MNQTKSLNTNIYYRWFQRAILVFLIGILFSEQILVYACTIFVVEDGDGTVLAGNNEDWIYSCPNQIQITAPDQECYGYVGFYNSYLIQGGMNEYGLFYDGASCPNTVVPFDREKKNLDYDLGKMVLSHCKTVEEVKTFLADYNIPENFFDHFLFADATGDSAVFEWVNDQFNVIPKDLEKNYQIVTNYWLSDPSLGNYPCERYDRVEQLLSSEKPSIELCNQILDDTKQDWKEGGTLYSNIYDLGNRTVYVYARGNFLDTYVLDLQEALDILEPGDKISYKFEDLNFQTHQEKQVTSIETNQTKAAKDVNSTFSLQTIILVSLILFGLAISFIFYYSNLRKK